MNGLTSAHVIKSPMAALMCHIYQTTKNQSTVSARRLVINVVKWRLQGAEAEAVSVI